MRTISTTDSKKRFGASRRYTWAIPLTLLTLIFAFATACDSFEPKIEADTVSGQAPLSVTFTNTGSDAETHMWQFGDGTDDESTGEAKTVSHTFTKAGTFTVNLVAAKGDESFTLPVSVNVAPGAIARVDIENWDGEIGAGSVQSVVAKAYDQYDNEVTDANLAFEVPSDAGAIDGSGNYQAATVTGEFTEGLKVTASRGAESVTASAELEVAPAPLSTITVEPSTIEATPTEVVNLEITAFDQHGNVIDDVMTAVSAPSAAGTATASGVFTAARAVTSGDNRLTVTVTHNDVSREMMVPVTVIHGPLDNVAISPASFDGTVTDEQAFTAVAQDEFGNEIPEATIAWSADASAGSIVDDGIYSSGFRSGEYTDAIVATASVGSESVDGTVDVALAPGEFKQVITTVTTVTAGDEMQLTATPADEYGNAVEDVELTWSVIDDSVGSVSESGLLTSSTVAGPFLASLSVEGTVGDVTASSEMDVTITAGALSQVKMLPGSIQLGIEQEQQYVAAAGDRFGNKIADVTFTWAADETAGTIDESGLFTASATPGNYTTAVTVTASYDGAEASASSAVEIDPDRIIFYSDRDNESGLYYTMNLDGTNATALTFGQVSTGSASFSPDGRRIVYDIFTIGGGVFLTDEDGSDGVNPWALIQQDLPVVYYSPEWSPNGREVVMVERNLDTDDIDLVLIDIDSGKLTKLTNSPNVSEFSPSWSPDGKFIVYNEGSAGSVDEIYRINATTGSRTRLTNNSIVDYQPQYSPDGTKIVFTSFRDGNPEIYVMNASNGTNQTRLTVSSESDQDPRWSPDGTKIIFSSFRDGDGEIHVMNADGSDVTKLTTNTDWDSDPEWMPRKAGMVVNENAIILPSESPTDGLSVQEITAQYRTSVVKIVTDLGSGSGFIIQSDGLILTNNHVVVDATTVTVTLDDGTEYDATVVGRDMTHDMAVLRIDASDLPALSFSVMTGDDLGADVVVLGYPLGSSDLNVTRGVVSAVKTDNGRNLNWIQTDAAINPGNSGGPMVNLKGEVVGIVSAGLFGAENIGLAIDSTTILTYLDRLIAGETVIIN